MQKLVEGVHSFQKEIFGSQQEFFSQLARGQHPIALFITCSDSRISPNLLTQTDPGELFILRNAGNIVPPYSTASASGEAATIEFAVSALGVRDIIICGHSHCGAMKGLLEPDSIKEYPAVRSWLNHAESTRRIMLEKYTALSGLPLLTATVEENVLVQLENIRTHPCVAAGLAKRCLTLHGWVYKLETGEVFEFDPQQWEFVPLTYRRPSTGPALSPRTIEKTI